MMLFQTSIHHFQADQNIRDSIHLRIGTVNNHSARPVYRLSAAVMKHVADRGEMCSKTAMAVTASKDPNWRAIGGKFPGE